jgi:uroporphyrinogen-III synthase
VDEAITRALAGKRIVVTRAPEQSGALVAALEAHGAIPVVLPLIAFAPPGDLRKLDDTVRNLRQFDWIFLTSQNALRAIEESCVRSDLSLRDVAGISAIAAVGLATAKATSDAGLEVRHVASKHDGVSMAQELARQVRGKKVFLPRSDRANPDLVRVLWELGAEVTEVVAYQTVRPASLEGSVQDAIVKKAPDAILFFSPSAARHLQELLGDETFRQLSERAVFAAIGPVTERALRGLGVTRIVQAEETIVDGILRGLIDYFGQSRSVLPAGVKQG